MDIDADIRIGYYYRGKGGDILNLKNLYKYAASDFMGYSRPNSYELVGKKIDLTFDSGRKTTLTLKRSPALTVTLSDGLNDQAAECLKIGGGIFLVNFAIVPWGATYILDYANGLVTHIVVGGDEPMADYGYIDEFGAKTERHALSDDLDGNTIDWTFSPSITARVKYSGGAANIAIPNMPPVSIPGFKAVRIANGIYFQFGQVSFGPAKVGLFLASDFTTLLFDGDLFGVPGLPALGTVGGWGKIITYEG
ncbi:MAG: hypothetical protein LBN97_08805 [Oscillospiraceae bacterium]|jgi:hypothetical protein|nr:hypothetical protein [Oscillospiraceae bacterium]